MSPAKRSSLSVLHKLGGATIDGAGYGLDAAGNRTSKSNSIDGSAEQYAYDAVYQLTQVTHNGAVSESYSRVALDKSEGVVKAQAS